VKSQINKNNKKIYLSIDEKFIEESIEGAWIK